MIQSDGTTDPEDEIPDPCAEALPKKVAIYLQLCNKRFLALYAHYAALGIVMSSTNLSTNACYYYFRGPDNVCANAWSLMVIPWGLKLFMALFVDSYSGPHGSSYRRKFYLAVGWGGALLFALILAVATDSLSVSVWVGLGLAQQFFAVLADTTADGLCIELGQIEPLSERGQVLATGQRVRFIFSVIGAAIQAVFVNGPSCNPPSCRYNSSKFGGCWSWGLTPSQYYGVVFALCAGIIIYPTFYFEDPSITLRNDAPSVSQPEATPHSFAAHKILLWKTLNQPTTLYLLIFISGNNLFSLLNSIVQWYVQYNLILLSSFQSGASSVLSAALTASVLFLLQRFLLGTTNWRRIQYANILFCAIMGLGWLIIYQGLYDPWFSIFLQINMSVGTTITQVLVGLAITELAPKGQETITYEVVLSVANSAITINNLLATQLLPLLGIDTCVRSVKTHCRDRPGSVNLGSTQSFDETGGPRNFSNYTWTIFAVNMAAMLVFTPFLPGNEQQCHEWSKKHSNPTTATAEMEMIDNPLAHTDLGPGCDGPSLGEESPRPQSSQIRAESQRAEGRDARTPSSATRLQSLKLGLRDFLRKYCHTGNGSIAICFLILLYQCVYALAMLIPQAACDPVFGGSGC